MEKTKIGRISFALIVILILLRFPLLFAGEAGVIDSMISQVVYLCGTYLCTGIFICANAGKLCEYCISVPAIVLFLGAPFLGLIANSDDPTALIKMAMAVAFAVFLYRKRKELRTVKTGAKQILPNVIFMVIIIVAATLIFAYVRGFSGGENLDPVTPRWIFESLLFQLSFAAISEEPLFRGFLWGFFRKLGLKEVPIAFLQAALFWVGHAYYMGTGLNFWVVIPLTSLALGLVILKTKSVSYSMVTHSFLNTLGDVFQHMVKLF